MDLPQGPTTNDRRTLRGVGFASLVGVRKNLLGLGELCRRFGRTWCSQKPVEASLRLVWFSYQLDSPTWHTSKEVSSHEWPLFRVERSGIGMWGQGRGSQVCIRFFQMSYGSSLFREYIGCRNCDKPHANGEAPLACHIQLDQKAFYSFGLQL